MYFSYVKVLMFFFYLMILFFSLMSFSWLFIWIGFEISILIYLLLFSENNQSELNSLVKYFIIQCLSSSMFIMSFISINLEYYSNEFFFFIQFISMWIKIGFFPFSSWFFQMSEGLSEMMWILLNSFQKVLPLMVFSLNFVNYNFIMLFIYFNAFYSLIEVFFQSSFRWIINCSSMNHFCWLILGMKMKLFIWQVYLLIYLFSLFFLFFYIYNKMLGSLLNFFMIKSKFDMMYFFILLMNFMSLPPFMGFYSKILVLKFFNNYFLMIILLSVSLLFVIVYLYIFIPLMLNYIYYNIFFNKINNWNFMLNFMIFLVFFFLSLI